MYVNCRIHTHRTLCYMYICYVLLTPVPWMSRGNMLGILYFQTFVEVVQFPFPIESGKATDKLLDVHVHILSIILSRHDLQYF